MLSRRPPAKECRNCSFNFETSLGRAERVRCTESGSYPLAKAKSARLVESKGSLTGFKDGGQIGLLGGAPVLEVTSGAIQPAAGLATKYRASWAVMGKE